MYVYYTHENIILYWHHLKFAGEFYKFLVPTLPNECSTLTHLSVLPYWEVSRRVNFFLQKSHLAALFVGFICILPGYLTVEDAFITS